VLGIKDLIVTHFKYHNIWDLFDNKATLPHQCFPYPINVFPTHIEAIGKILFAKVPRKIKEFQKLKFWNFQIFSNIWNVPIIIEYDTFKIDMNIYNIIWFPSTRFIKIFSNIYYDDSMSKTRYSLKFQIFSC